ncbi:hypothetical protein C5C66_01360 [Rathayibacter toxicus]|uniref:DUF308 domain-containing protein n=1 Tax=Rathayibacter toxicus TaxID=145458 RepID=A0A0C5BQU6_9MICO|nr:hypothetical protein TI83_01555 [Rathayibacter toxicus]ALS57192.1 hypothetical protein APU90_04935 [Rathayibacter toxicus]KKM46005.1 hypothetical protein VT73_02570 [Rathayibacter toxicus]PPG22934.1 hypothetical protein C5D15_01335 [Rathayibacter toxicus]PPG47515.1 hypothetical protein C5D16_01325 [Rathayibacter toxicus]
MLFGLLAFLLPRRDRPHHQRGSTVAHSADTASRLWLLPLARAAVAGVIGCVVTFSPDHGPAMGLLVCGAFAISGGAVSVITALLTLTARARLFAFCAAAVTLLVGVAAFIALPVANLLSFVALLAGWALVAGALEFSSGCYGQGIAARDRRVVGVGTMLFGAAFALLPAQPVAAVGLFGAYAVMLAVYLAIAAFSLKWVGAAAAVARSTPTPRGNQ